MNHFHHFILFVSLSVLLLSCGQGDKSDTLSPEDSVAQMTAFQAGEDAAADSLSYALGRGYSASKEDMQAMLLDAGVDSAYIGKMIEGMTDALHNDPEALAYFIGYQSGVDLRSSIIERAEAFVFGEDSTHHLSVRNFLAGFCGEVFGTQDFRVDGRPLTQATAGDFANNLLVRLSEANFSKQYAAERQAAEAFMAGKAKEPGIRSLDGGVLYRVIRPGKGPHPTDGNVVTITFEGRLMDGTVFDESSKPVECEVSKFITGFSTALKAMPLGAEWEVYVPWQLAYGAQGIGDIPPFSALSFHLHLIDFK